MSNISDLYPFLRCVLGDRLVMERWNYQDCDLLNAVRTTLALGRGPDGYAPVGSVGAATMIAPDLVIGDPTAILVYETALIMVAGEDGMKVIRTRELTVHDGGDRKKDLILELKLQVDNIRNGGAVFGTQQSLAQFLSAGGFDWPEFTSMRLVSGPPSLRV